MGYRCMACDRPLVKLDDRRGPHLPTFQLPVSVSGQMEQRSQRNLSPLQQQQQQQQAQLSPQNSETKLKKNYNYDPEKRGPQNWWVHCYCYCHWWCAVLLS